MTIWRSFAVGCLAAVVLASACGGDDDGAAESPRSTDEGEAPDGEPILLGVISIGEETTPASTYLANSVDGAQAAAEAVNAEGGVQGRPIEIIGCDTRGDPNVAATCARDMIDDGVVAIVGSYSRETQAWLPITEAAGVPSIGHLAGGAADLDDSLRYTYPISVGVPGLVIGQGALAGELGAERPSIVRNDVPATAQAVDLVSVGLGEAGLEVANEVVFPVSAPEMSSYVAAATRDGSDAIIAVISPPDLVNFVRALRQTGSDVPIVAVNSSIELAIDSGFADELEGVHGVGYTMTPTQTDHPDVQAFRDELEAAAPGAPATDLTANAWSSVHLFADVAADLATVNAASVVEALNQLTSYDPLMLPEVDFTRLQDTIPGARIFGSAVVFSEVVDGEIRALTGEFVTVL